LGKFQPRGAEPLRWAVPPLDNRLMSSKPPAAAASIGVVPTGSRQAGSRVRHKRQRRAAPCDPTGVTRWLFLVAGSAGSGKSTLAKALAHELHAGWLQLDSIWLAMKVAAGDGTPTHDVLNIDRRMRREDEADDDVLAAHVAASGEVCRALPTVLGLELQAHERLVVDGAWLLPSFVTELELPDTEVSAVYVVQRTEADVEAALIPRRGGLPLEDRHRLMNRRIFQYGAWLADEARAHDLPVVEALPFESLLNRARAALLSES
jgi:2-phosphoglycerate kinase